MNLSGYNIRVYGILTNSFGEILLSKEHRFGKKFTKFPGGGHELGEGLIDGLKREFKEELDISINILSHFYTTDYFQVSAFDKGHQLISIYYKVSSAEAENIANGMSAVDLDGNTEHQFIWKSIDQLTVEEVTYPVDKLVVEMLLKENSLASSLKV